MSDQCQNCIHKGDLKACESEPCTIHESWYVSSLQQQNTALQQQVKDLQSEKSVYVGVDFSKDYTAEIKVAAIIEAMQGAPCNNESHDEIHRYIEEYANTLSSKGGD